MDENTRVLTFIFVLRCDGDDGVLNVLILVDLGFVRGLLEIRRIVVLVADADTDVLGHCKEHKTKTIYSTSSRKRTICIIPNIAVNYSNILH